MQRSGRIALVHGGGQGVWDDSNRALKLVAEAGARVTYICVNDAGEEFPGTLHHWGSLHPDTFPWWEHARRENGWPDTYTRWSTSQGHYVDRVVSNWTGGSSGQHALDIALNALGCDGAILCGVPVDDRPNEFTGERWGAHKRFRPAWQDRRKDPILREQVRSMSGWTKELLGEPTKEWIRKVTA